MHLSVSALTALTDPALLSDDDEIACFSVH